MSRGAAATRQDDIALCTALAGEMQGKHVLYMDAGSGAKRPISEKNDCSSG